MNFQRNKLFMGRQMQYCEISPRGKSSGGFCNGDRGIILLCLSQGEGDYPVTASRKGEIVAHNYKIKALVESMFHTLSRASDCLKWALLEH